MLVSYAIFNNRDGLEIIVLYHHFFVLFSIRDHLRFSLSASFECYWSTAIINILLFQNLTSMDVKFWRLKSRGLCLFTMVLYSACSHYVALCTPCIWTVRCTVWCATYTSPRSGTDVSHCLYRVVYSFNNPVPAVGNPHIENKKL